MNKMLTVGMISGLFLMIGCQANDIKPIEENDIKVIEEQPIYEDTVDEEENIYVPEENTNENEENIEAILIDEIISLGKQTASEGYPEMAIYEHLDAFKEIASKTDDVLIQNLVNDLIAYDNYATNDYLLAIVNDLAALDQEYTSNDIHEVWLIFGGVYDEYTTTEYEATEFGTYEEPVYEQPVQEQPQKQSTLMIYYINARVSSYNTLAYDSEYGTANEQGYDYVIYDFIDGAVLIGGDSLVRLNISTDDGATALTLSQIDSSFDYYEVRDMLRNDL